MTIDDVLTHGAPPVVAILRGVKPDEVAAIGEALVAAGVRLIEVPLNSPDPFDSVRLLVETLGDRALCGAGTVLTPADVDRVAAAGGRLIVTPNTNPAVISRAVELGLEPMPGFATPSEAFAAYGAGARRLKLFPATGFGTGYLKAIREVLPRDASAWAVGGTGANNIGEWLAAGAEGIGVGGALYRPGDTASQVAERAAALVTAWQDATRGQPG
jgi:2-dehydro-3-deoxyphosphogalactonate aldolase